MALSLRQEDQSSVVAHFWWGHKVLHVVVGDFLLQDCFGDLCLFAFRSLAMGLECRLVSTDSQVSESSEVGSVVHSEHIAFSRV